MRSEKIHCAFCKLPHRIYLQKDLGVIETLGFAVATALISFTIWGRTDLKSLVIFVFLLVAGEIFVRMRWRQSLRCPHCGFDPVVYRADPEQAAEKVKTFMAARKSDPNFLLKPTPKIAPIIRKSDDWRKNLPAVQGEAKAKDSKGRLTDFTI